MEPEYGRYLTLSTIGFAKYNRQMARADQDAARAWQLLTQLFFARRGELPTLAAELELSPVQCHVLHLLEPDQPMAMGRLAETLACDASNVTGLVDRLESRGLIVRQPSAHDRRVKVLALTPTGARLRTQLHKRMADPPEPFRRLTAAEQRTLVKILERLLS
jgi:MarR family transcriptional regulator, organic hydroperoxide resistance regulator